MKHRSFSSVSCEDLDRRDGWGLGGVGGRFKRKRVYVYTQLIHFTVQQKLKQHCKAITFQKKKNKVTRWLFSSAKALGEEVSYL